MSWLAALMLLAAAPAPAQSSDDSDKLRHHMEVNENSKNNLYGRLQKQSRDSGVMNADQEMTDEERRETIKTMFEGQGYQSNQIITQEERAGPPGTAVAASAALQAGYFDRLSRGNLRGYSAQLQALQSSLNQRRAPGAPKLIETGRLDYETLSYPFYGIRHDIETLEARLGAELAAKVAANDLLARRRAALERAASAARAFQRAAAAAKDPAKITRELLVDLGARQREAARWIAVASLEEELERLRAIEGLLSPELQDAIARCPVPAADQAAFRRRGVSYVAEAGRLRAEDERAIDELETGRWVSHPDELQRTLDVNLRARAILTGRADDLGRAAFRLGALPQSPAGWRAALVEWTIRLTPESERARRLRAERQQRRQLIDAFLKIAAGELDAAHAVLAGRM